MAIALSPKEQERLSEALLDAYRSQNALKRMVKFRLEENLEAIAGSGKLHNVVFELIDWADARGRLADLVMGAYTGNSGNPKLKAFYETVFRKQFIVELEGAIAQTGPDIDWRGTTDELQLQGLFRSPPDWYDVGFLKRAIARAASVCRIEIPYRGIQGTGVAIAPQLVLTNYHVLDPDGNGDLQDNAREARLHFGCFTGEDGKEVTGHSFRLDEGEPILCSRPTAELDYVLLKVESGIRQVKAIESVEIAIAPPVPRMGLNLLQHPQGDSMKLSISCDGIDGVYPEWGLVQYVNRTAGGSSGAPCFNDDWQLVALHHAERSRYFGAIREGILLSSIYPQIQSFL